MKVSLGMSKREVAGLVSMKLGARVHKCIEYI